MKTVSRISNSIVAVGMAAALTFTTTASADESVFHDKQAYRGTKATLIFGNTIAGMLIAGPIGAVAGTATGIWLTERVTDGYEKQAAEIAAADLQAENAELREQFAMLNVDNAELQRLAAESLEFQVLFHTGTAELSDTGAARIARLAEFLTEQDSLEVHLSGFADPRGDLAYNDELSQARVDNVAALLIEAGIDPERITAEAFGASHSVAATGDLDAYALERRVSIELLPTVDATSVAAR